MTQPPDQSKLQSDENKLPFTCPNCGKDFGWGDGSAPIFLGIVNSIPFTDEPTPCCGYKISGTINRDLEMELV